MSRESLPEMVDAYDTNTGNKVRVPRAWIDSTLYPQFTLSAPQKRADHITTPTRSSSKTDWVTYATLAAPEATRLSKEAAEAMSRDELANRYAQEG